MAHELLDQGSMIEIALEKFPFRTTLNDGAPCSLRPMEMGDENAFREFHSVIPDREQLYIKNRIKDGSLFREWMSDPEFGEHLPLVAFIDGRLVATGILHQRLGGWKRHIGKVYFLTHPQYRGLGLIDVLLEEIVEVAQHCGLTKLESEINGERVSAIESMVAVGFRELVRVPDYIQDMRGNPHDYVLMGMDLVASFENLGAGD
ncbi:MAG: GNAT family N-acetyltransferase [Verrucomicrobiae bacterium]|nr:GNAT family N-acetyltransferase [Verrucomicrobiae bacterium]